MNITVEAQLELKKALEKFNKTGACIHLFNTKGCCGSSIQMDITTQIGKEETQISQDGIDFYVANDTLPALAEITIEYGAKGFRLVGMKKNSSCC